MVGIGVSTLVGLSFGCSTERGGMSRFEDLIGPSGMTAGLVGIYADIDIGTDMIKSEVSLLKAASTFNFSAFAGTSLNHSSNKSWGNSPS